MGEAGTGAPNRPLKEDFLAGSSALTLRPLHGLASDPMHPDLGHTPSPSRPNEFGESESEKKQVTVLLKKKSDLFHA